MKLIEEVFRLSVQYLEQRSISRSKFLVQHLLCHILKMNKLELFMQFDRPVEENQLGEIRSHLAQLGRGKPLEQLLGYVEFYGSCIRITADVLIPRPETELLVDIIAKDRSLLSCSDVWDVCTGSGCIAISLKKIFPSARVIMSDLCSKALALAVQNALDASVIIESLQGDLLAPFGEAKADLIVCNPPYISTDECACLDRSVRDYEPLSALDGGADGLLFYRRLSKDLPRYLKPSGKVYFEIGFNQGASLSELFSDPIWVKKQLIKDLSGHDRFFFLEIE